MTDEENRTLERCISIAVSGHAGQVDKAGEPYILHPLRVMMMGATPLERMVGVLHDVLEDTCFSEVDLRLLRIPEVVIDAVRLLTKAQGYPEVMYLRFIRQHDVARVVKLNDIRDNTDPARMMKLDKATRVRLTMKYQRYVEALGGYDRP